MTMLHTLHI